MIHIPLKKNPPPQKWLKKVQKAKDELDARRVFSDLPPLVKGYLRLGAYIGKGAFIDNHLQQIDVCIILPTKNVTEKYKKHYELKA